MPSTSLILTWMQGASKLWVARSVLFKLSQHARAIALVAALLAGSVAAQQMTA